MTDFPLQKFHFKVEWGGAEIGFQEVSGLSKKLGVLEYRDGQSKQFFKRKMPGMQELSNITLKRGVFYDNNEFDEWYKTAMLNTVEKRDIIISLLNEMSEPAVVWTVKDCFIVSLVCTDMNAEENGNAIETVEIANHGFTIEHV